MATNQAVQTLRLEKATVLDGDASIEMMQLAINEWHLSYRNSSAGAGAAAGGAGCLKLLFTDPSTCIMSLHQLIVPLHVLLVLNNRSMAFGTNRQAWLRTIDAEIIKIFA